MCNVKKWLCYFLTFVALCIIASCHDLTAANALKRKVDLYNNIKNNADPYQMVEALKKQIHAKDDELEKAEQINKNFERLMQLVNILGQVDSFLTDRTRVMIKKLAMLADSEDEGYDYKNKNYNNNNNNRY